MKHKTPPDALPAEVIRVRHGIATIRCPYCGEEHEHQVPVSGRQHRPAACHLYAPINPSTRLTGYVFTTERRYQQ